MKNQHLAFALFAAAILFSMMREWSAPSACVRAFLPPTVAAKQSATR
jgi:hypothetical protein